MRGALLRAGVPAVVLLLAACTSVGVSPAPDASPAPTRTLNPNELELASRSSPPEATSTPTITVTPSITVAPTTTPTPTLAPPPTPAAPDLEALLPERIAGADYRHASIELDVAQDVAGGDTCSLFCPGEISAYAKLLGVTAGLARVAVALPADRFATTGAVIRAIQLEGIHGRSAKELEQAWAEHWTTTEPGLPVTQRRTISGKSVLLILGSPQADPRLDSYAYAVDDTLFLVDVRRDPADSEQPGPIAEETFSLLP